MKYKNSVNEWYNSIYSYNFNKLNIILHNKSNIINILLSSYFNLKKWKLKKTNSIIKINKLFNFNLLFKKFDIKNLSFLNLNLKKNIYLYNIKKFNKLKKWKLKKISYIKWLNKKNNLKILKSLKRIFISFPYIKHSNNKINLLLFIFNKYKLMLLYKIKKLNRLVIRIKRKYKYNKNIKKFNQLKKYNKSNKKINKLIKRTNKYKLSNKNIKKVLILRNKKKYLSLKNLIIRNIIYKKKYNILKRNYLSNLYFNLLKFNNINLLNVKNIIYKIYSKKVNINIINMKYLYLDNSNLIQAITRKLNDRKKRVLKILKKTLKLVKLAKFLNYINRYNWNNSNTIHYLRQLNYKSIYNNIINNIKNKHLIGIFLEAKGRLTRRMTASRAVYKLRYKGNMKNPYNINKSSKLNRGYIKPNVIINKNNSYNKNGSFGITSKINTY